MENSTGDLGWEEINGLIIELLQMLATTLNHTKDLNLIRSGIGKMVGDLLHLKAMEDLDRG